MIVRTGGKSYTEKAMKEILKSHSVREFIKKTQAPEAEFFKGELESISFGWEINDGRMLTTGKTVFINGNTYNINRKILTL